MPLQHLSSDELTQLALDVTKGRIYLTPGALQELIAYCTDPVNTGHANIAESIRKTDNLPKGTPGHRPAQAALLAMVQAMKLPLLKHWLADGAAATTPILLTQLPYSMQLVWNAFVAVSATQDPSVDRAESTALNDLPTAFAGAGTSSAIDYLIKQGKSAATTQAIIANFAKAMNAPSTTSALQSAFVMTAAPAAQHYGVKSAIEASQAMNSPIAKAGKLLASVHQTLTPLKGRIQGRGLFHRALQTATGGTDTGRASLRVSRAARTLSSAKKRYEDKPTQRNLDKLRAAQKKLELRLEQAEAQIVANRTKDFGPQTTVAARSTKTGGGSGGGAGGGSSAPVVPVRAAAADAITTSSSNSDDDTDTAVSSAGSVGAAAKATVSPIALTALHLKQLRATFEIEHDAGNSHSTDLKLHNILNQAGDNWPVRARILAQAIYQAAHSGAYFHDSNYGLTKTDTVNEIQQKITQAYQHENKNTKKMRGVAEILFHQTKQPAFWAQLEATLGCTTASEAADHGPAAAAHSRSRSASSASGLFGEHAGAAAAAAATEVAPQPTSVIELLNIIDGAGSIKALSKSANEQTAKVVVEALQVLKAADDSAIARDSSAAGVLGGGLTAMTGYMFSQPSVKQDILNILLANADTIRGHLAAVPGAAAH